MSTQIQADAAALKAEVRGQLWKDNLRDYGLLGSLLLIVLFFYVITADHASVAPVNITNLIMQNSYVVIMALGMLLIIVGGNIDLSVGSIVGFVGAIGGSLIVYQKVPYPLVIVVCLAVGALIGAAQGVLVAYAKMPSFIVTLGGMLIFRGLTGNMLLGQFVGPVPERLPEHRLRLPARHHRFRRNRRLAAGMGQHPLGVAAARRPRRALDVRRGHPALAEGQARRRWRSSPSRS